MYKQYGYYQEDLISITKKGMNGQAEIAQMMETFRSNPPKHLGGRPVVQLLDYQLQEATDLSTGKKTPIDLPKSNVLQFLLDDGSKISARPSGTEPKIKFYFSVNMELEDVSQFDSAQQQARERIKGIIEEMQLK